MNLVGLAFYTLIFFLSVEADETYSHLLTGMPADTVICRPDTVRIVCVGDIMLGTDYPSKIYLPPAGDCSNLLRHVKPYLLDADITCGNLEGTFAGDSGIPKNCKDTTMCFVFRMPDEFVNCLAESGFDFLSLANNHSGDFGPQGRIRTQQILDSAGIGTGGLTENPFSIMERKGIRFGFCAFSPHPGTLNLRDPDRMEDIIRTLDELCDIIIVSFHGGGEGEEHQHITKQDETYLGFNRGNVYEFAHRAVDAGGDIIYGHGPHVTRALEIYNERIILYSLGNFCTYARFKLTGPNGVAPMVKVFVDKKGKFIGGNIYPMVQHERGIPRIDPAGKAIRLLKNLTAADFPDSNVQIDDQGRISPEIFMAKDSLSIDVKIGTFLGNSRRNFYGNSAPDRLEVLWKVYLGEGETLISRKLGTKTWAGAGWTGQPLLVEEMGKLYVIQGAYDHHLKKMDARTGELIWQYRFDDVVKGTGTIWLNNKAGSMDERYIILQGSRLGAGNYLDSPHIPSFRAISYITGKELWRLDSRWTDSYSRDVDASALVISDTAYIGLENGMFVVFDPDPRNAGMTDGMIQPKVHLTKTLYTQEDVRMHNYNVVTEASPCLLANRIYLNSGSGHVYGYNLETKTIDWDFYIGSDMDGSPVVTGDSCLLIPVEKQYIKGNGGVFKLDPSRDPENAVVWFFPAGNNEFVSWQGGIVGSAGITDYYRMDSIPDLAATIGIDGYLYVLNHRRVRNDTLVSGPDSLTLYPTPELVYKKYLGPSISTPVFVHNRLIVAGYNGIFLFEFNEALEFVLLDKFQTSFEATPIAWDRRIYIASRDGFFYCLGEHD